MDPITVSAPAVPTVYMLRFESLFQTGRAFSFPCDSQGRVALDDMSACCRNNYLFARTVVGRDFATPCVVQM